MGPSTGYALIEGRDCAWRPEHQVVRVTVPGGRQHIPPSKHLFSDELKAAASAHIFLHSLALRRDLRNSHFSVTIAYICACIPITKHPKPPSSLIYVIPTCLLAILTEVH